MAEGSIILPVWHGVTNSDVYNYSAFLADIRATNTNRGIAIAAANVRNP